MTLKDVSTEELFNHVGDMLQEIERRKEEWSEKLQYFDKKISNIYHKIETEKFDENSPFELTIELQKMLRFRRVIKRDRYIFECVNDFCNDDRHIDWNKAAKFLKDTTKLSCLADGTIRQHKKWSNEEELGAITYEMVDEEFNKKFGSLENQLLKLERAINAG